ncbi:MAG: spore coat protein [Planctomycetaceae bacterium]
MTRRILLWLGMSTLPFGSLLAADELVSEGPPPPVVMFEHFPDRLHACVWRNWDLVPTATLARVLRANEDQLTAVAASMGLPPNRPVSDRHQRQIYITIVRRNWHLLPLQQLLELIGMSREEFAFRLREDDVLYIKLGPKPRCEPLRYAEPEDSAKRHAAQIKAVVERHFGQKLTEHREERFAFVEKLSAARPRSASSAPVAEQQGLRFIYSYFGVFGDPLMDGGADPFPDGLLERLAEVGVNGVWMHVVLRQLAPGTPDFPEFGDGHQQRLENLRQIVRRAERHGIRVYLYINEPRAQPEAFFAQRTDMAGVREGDHIAMCTSDPRVRKWLSDALTHVFREVPGLGGVFTITASENLTSCASHYQQKNCPRCRQRSEAEIIGEVNAAVEHGVHRASPDAKVLCWDWGWAGHGDAPKHITQMPANTWLMSVSEWSQPFDRGGIKGAVGEYSLSVVGPGPRATRHWELAKQRGLKTAARVSFNSTWELSTLPYLPVMDIVAQHCTNLAGADVDGLMLSWSLGGYPSPNLKVAQRIIGHTGIDAKKVLDELAAERYGRLAAPYARKAWSSFSDAFREFPYGLGLYSAPQQVGPANLLYRTSTGYAATMTCYPYDDLQRWSGQYPPEVLATQFQKVADGWAAGLKPFERAVEQSDPDKKSAAKEDLAIAQAAHTYWASVSNQIRFVVARDQQTRQEKPELRADLSNLLDDEITQARRLFELAQQDSGIGFEAANQYFYVPLDLVEKVVSCENLKRQSAER